MEQLDVVDSINNAGNWLVRNQALLLSYAVNIVAAIAIIIVGMIVARIVSNAVNRVMVARHIDATVADFLSALVRYGIIAFTLIAALGRVGVQTASVIAVLGAAGLAIGLVTPPVGMCLNACNKINRMPIIEIFKGAAPYVICNVIVLISISLWGPLTTALPQLLGYSIF